MQSVDRQVQESITAGAHILTGGQRLDCSGYFYPPTVLTGVPRNAPVCREEVFGPVAPLIPVADLAEAIQVANDTNFGLGASLWTNDADEQSALIEEIDLACASANQGLMAFQHHPCVPKSLGKRSKRLNAVGLDFVRVRI